MLVLSRQRDESIEIGEVIKVTVIDIRGDKVRLGFTAPGHFAIYRKEVYDDIIREIKAGKAPPVARPKGGGGKLVLSRQRDEATVMVDLDAGWDAPLVAEVTVVDIRGDKVRLGVIAPRETSVHRQEVADAIRHDAAHNVDCQQEQPRKVG